ncbi:hypothetical protein AB1K83_09610 [Sporosarcina sp. 179-K 3D1 HS]
MGGLPCEFDRAMTVSARDMTVLDIAMTVRPSHDSWAECHDSSTGP